MHVSAILLVAQVLRHTLPHPTKKMKDTNIQQHTNILQWL